MRPLFSKHNVLAYGPPIECFNHDYRFQQKMLIHKYMHDEYVSRPQSNRDSKIIKMISPKDHRWIFVLLLYCCYCHWSSCVFKILFGENSMRRYNDVIVKFTSIRSDWCERLKCKRTVLMWFLFLFFLLLFFVFFFYLFCFDADLNFVNWRSHLISRGFSSLFHSTNCI